MNRLLTGALAGLAATAPMTLVMEEIHRYLPPHEQYPLPPRLITDRVAEDTGAARQLDEDGRERLTFTSHFSYGAAAGAIYALLAERVGVSSLKGGVKSGILYGLMVWAGSYMMWLPAAGIMRPATEHPPHRTSLMIAAHVVWGATLGALVGFGRRGRRRW